MCNTLSHGVKGGYIELRIRPQLQEPGADIFIKSGFMFTCRGVQSLNHFKAARVSAVYIEMTEWKYRYMMYGLPLLEPDVI